MAEAEALAALLMRCADGDRAAFRELYAAVSPRLHGIVLRVLRDRDAAADALQEAFLRIWSRASAFQAGRGHPMAWMGVIARRCALDRVAADRPTEPLDAFDIAADVETPRDPRLAACLERLPEMHRKAVLLTYLYGMTHTELADALGAPLGTVKTWVRRGALALKECLDP